MSTDKNLEILVGVLVSVIILIALYNIIPLVGSSLDEAGDIEDCTPDYLSVNFTNSTRDGDVIVLTADSWLWTVTEECYEFDLNDSTSSDCVQVNVSNNNSAIASVSAITSVINSSSTLVYADNDTSILTLTATECGEDDKIEVETSCDLEEV